MSIYRNRHAPWDRCRPPLPWLCMVAVTLYEPHPRELPKPRRWRMSGGPPAFELRAGHDIEPGEEPARPTRDGAQTRLWRIARGEDRGFLRQVARDLDEWRTHGLDDSELGEWIANLLATGRLRLVELPEIRPNLPLVPEDTKAPEPAPEPKRAPAPEATIEVGTDAVEVELTFATNLEADPALEFSNELEAHEFEFGRELEAHEFEFGRELTPGA